MAIVRYKYFTTLLKLSNKEGSEFNDKQKIWGARGTVPELIKSTSRNLWGSFSSCLRKFGSVVASIIILLYSLTHNFKLSTDCVCYFIFPFLANFCYAAHHCSPMFLLSHNLQCNTCFRICSSPFIWGCLRIKYPVVPMPNIIVREMNIISLISLFSISNLHNFCCIFNKFLTFPWFSIICLSILIYSL